MDLLDAEAQLAEGQLVCPRISENSERIRLPDCVKADFVRGRWENCNGV